MLARNIRLVALSTRDQRISASLNLISSQLLKPSNIAEMKPQGEKEPRTISGCHVCGDTITGAFLLFTFIFIFERNTFWKKIIATYKVSKMKAF